MTTDRSIADCDALVERRIDSALDAAEGVPLPLVGAVMAEHDDRWYGQVLARSYAAVAGRMSTDPVGSAAAAVEFLRGYCRLRNELLVQTGETTPHSFTREPTPALLAGDYLYSLAFSTLTDVDHSSTEVCYDRLADTSERLIETLASRHAAPSSADHCTLVDGTVGSLGECAAVVGATLAGVDRGQRDHFASLGRSLSTASRIRRSLESDGESDEMPPPRADAERLRRHASRHATLASGALGPVEPVVETAWFDPLFDRLDGSPV